MSDDVLFLLYELHPFLRRSLAEVKKDQIYSHLKCPKVFYRSIMQINNAFAFWILHKRPMITNKIEIIIYCILIFFISRQITNFDITKWLLIVKLSLHSVFNKGSKHNQYANSIDDNINKAKDNAGGIPHALYLYFALIPLITLNLK